MLAQSLEAEGETLALEPERGLRLEQAFARGAGHGLVLLGADEVGTTLSPALSYWRKLGARYMTALCALPGIGERSKPPVPIPADGELDTMAAAVPPMIGAEYVTTEVLVNLWRGMDLTFDTELAQSKLTVQEFLKRRHLAWNLVGRVHFNLAEDRKDEDAPFAFNIHDRRGATDHIHDRREEIAAALPESQGIPAASGIRPYSAARWDHIRDAVKSYETHGCIVELSPNSNRLDPRSSWRS
jgi:hypothetical protein